MEYPFEGIPTVPPRKDMDHMVMPDAMSMNTIQRECRLFIERIKDAEI